MMNIEQMKVLAFGEIREAYVTELKRLLVTARNVDELSNVRYALEAVAEECIAVIEEAEQAEAMELPEVSLEEAAEALFCNHLDQWAEECKELAYQDFERRGVSRERVNAYLTGSTAHKVGA